MKAMNWLALLCALTFAGACNRNGSTPTDDALARRQAQSDSMAGEVTQYALMKNSIGWLTDSNLVSLAGTVNHGPIELARIEAQLWSNERIHDFAVDVLREHLALQTSIDSLAAKRRIPSQAPAIAPSMKAPYDSVVASLAGLPLEEMEPRFVDAMIAMHRRTTTDFAALAGNASDPDLRTLLATRVMLMEQAHVGRAKLVAASVQKADSARRANAERGRKP